jgi:hypothetical protein
VVVGVLVAEEKFFGSLSAVEADENGGNLRRPLAVLGARGLGREQIRTLSGTHVHFIY